MKKFLCFAVAAMMMTGCGMMKSSGAGNASQSNGVVTNSSSNALSAGQGAGNALLQLYNQYKADGRYDYSNMQNVLNTVSLLANCEGLKSNYTNTAYLKDFGKGLIASSLGLVTQNNVQTVTSSLVSMVQNSEALQTTTTQAQSTATTAAGYANTAAQYAGAISSLLSAFGNK